MGFGVGTRSKGFFSVMVLMDAVISLDGEWC